MGHSNGECSIFWDKDQQEWRRWDMPIWSRDLAEALTVKAEAEGQRMSYMQLRVIDGSIRLTLRQIGLPTHVALASETVPVHYCIAVNQDPEHLDSAHEVKLSRAQAEEFANMLEEALDNTK